MDQMAHKLPHTDRLDVLISLSSIYVDFVHATDVMEASL